MLSDQPIQSAKDDLLGRAAFSRQVASSMLACPSDKRSSFTIALNGGWGSGKTSILNMVTEALKKQRTVGQPPRPTPIIIQCNPWHYPAAEHSTGQFLRTLAAELKKPEHGKKLRKAGKAMEKYAAALQTCAPHGKTAVKTGNVAEVNGKPNPKQKKNKRLKIALKQKTKVFKRLKKQKQKIYIIMDDIDRLSSRRIRHVLQMVNAVAGFPRMVYLLAYDQDVVTRALSKELNADGREYLKKFIQAQFTVPAPQSDRIHAVLNAYIAAWQQAQADLNFDPVYFGEISPFLFSCLTSIRDVYRFINTFRFQYQALGNEVNFVDLLAVTALQLFIPQALPWMQTHRDDLLRGGGLAFYSAYTARKHRLKREHRRMLSELCETCSQTLLPMIGHMFPRYGRNILDVYGDDSSSRYVRMRRICCEEFFDLYFTLSPEGLTITQEEILSSIRKMDTAALRKFTDGLAGTKRANAYITQLPHYLDDIPQNKLLMFFLETLWLSRLPEEKTPSEKPFQRSFFQECCYCALRILAQMNEDMRATCLADAAAQADEHTIPILVLLLERVRCRNPDANNVVIGDEAMETHLKMILGKVRAFSQYGNWLHSHKPLPVLEFWKQEDPESFKPYFDLMKKDDRNMARLISCLIYRFDSGTSMEYQYGDMNSTHMFWDDFTQAEALAAILRLRGTAAFAALPEDVQLDCVAFSLMDENGSRVTHQEVLEAYTAWKTV